MKRQSSLCHFTSPSKKKISHRPHQDPRHNFRGIKLPNNWFSHENSVLYRSYKYGDSGQSFSGGDSVASFDFDNCLVGASFTNSGICLRFPNVISVLREEVEVHSRRVVIFTNAAEIGRCKNKE